MRCVCATTRGIDASDVLEPSTRRLPEPTLSTLTFLARGMVRRQLLGLAALGVVAGLGLGVAMTAATDARRAESAYARLRRASLAPDALFGAVGLKDQDLDRLAALPGVTGIARFSYTPVAPSPLVPGVDGGAFVGFDPDFLVRVYRPVALRGRLPDPAAIDEVVVNEGMAQAAHLRVGQRVRLVAGFEDPTSIGSATVVGVVRGIFDVGANAGSPSMLLSKTFLDGHRADIQLGPQPAALVRLARGEAGLTEFQRRAGEVVGHAVNVQFSGTEEAKPTERTLRVQTVGLAVLATVAALSTLAAVIQAFNRLGQRALIDLPILVAIGVKPRQRVGLGVLLAVPVAVVGATVSVGAAVLASPLIPTGFARKVDPLRGVHPDLSVLSLGIVVWALTLGGAGAMLAWRWGRRSEGAMATGRIHRLLSALPYRARLGGESALVPLRSAGGAAARGVLAVGHGLWSSIRARRRDLAVLASIGFRPRDIRAMLLWQVTCVAAIGAIVGGVVGAVVGGRAWSAVASATAVVDHPVTPVLGVGLISASALLASWAVGLAGGRWMQVRPVTVGLQEE